MTTATAPPTTERRELPRLRTDHIPKALEVEEFEAAGKRRELLAQAVKSRAKAQDAEKAIKAAIDQDTAALRDAALAGRKDPGRKHEMAAIRESEAAHREALALTLAANEALDQTAAAVRGEPGAELQTKIAARVEAAQAQFVKHLDAVDAELAEMGGLAAFAEWVAKARKGDGRLPASRGDALKGIHISGGPQNNPAALVEALRAWKPEW